MKYEAFKSWVDGMPCFTAQDVVTLSGQDPSSVAVSLTRWVQRGRMERLRRGLYTLNANDRKVPLTQAYLASVLVEPSYLSGVWALANESVIPEAVFSVISATKGRLTQFKNNYGKFQYHRIPGRAWFGYTHRETENGIVLFAHKEKALLDTIYWSQSTWDAARFRQERVHSERLDLKRLTQYADEWGLGALIRSVEEFSKYKESTCQTW